MSFCLRANAVLFRAADLSVPHVCCKKTTSNIHVHDFDDEAVMLFFHTFHVVEIISQTVDIHILQVEIFHERLIASVCFELQLFKFCIQRDSQH